MRSQHKDYTIVPTYTIENEYGHKFDKVFDDQLTIIPVYYVLSFSEREITIHQINAETFNKKYANKAKSMFVFHKLQEAYEAKLYFEDYKNNRQYIIG